ncbi:type I-E CRISPR-associated protein Cas5/CasD [Thermomonas brevis]
MRWLLFDLHAPLASFGGTAPGSVRDTGRVPSRSALLGLCAAALGSRRDDAAAHAQLDQSLLFASRCFHDERSHVLRDYHTAQAPQQSALKRHPQHTRRDELQVPKTDLSTVLSDRYYLQNLHCTVGVTLVDGSAMTLEALADALRRPRFTLYVGRKSCPLHWPLHPRVVEAEDWPQALALDREQRVATGIMFAKVDRTLPFLPEEPPSKPSETLAWDARLLPPAQLDDAQRSQLREVQRHDQPLDRELWRYAQRSEIQWTRPGAPA